jgi:hypothetical protein
MGLEVELLNLPDCKYLHVPTCKCFILTAIQDWLGGYLHTQRTFQVFKAHFSLFMLIFCVSCSYFCNGPSVYLLQKTQNNALVVLYPYASNALVLKGF